MLIDWFTVIAQAVNFLILVWLLKRFLYQPIINAIDARERHIAAQLADADAKKAEALIEREEFKRKNEEFDRGRAALQSRTTEEATAERRRLFDAARRDADVLSTKQQDKLRSEYQRLNEEIARRTRSEVFAIARKTLADLAGASLETQMVEVFVRRLRDLDTGEKKKTALMPQTSPVLVRSAFELAPAQRSLIEDAVKETLATEIQVKFEIAPDLISGIELLVLGQKFAWSIADYLAALDKDINELLKTQPGTTTQSPNDHR
jgi:F-type H+-transporting ATPase subunit b